MAPQQQCIIADNSQRNQVNVSHETTNSVVSNKFDKSQHLLKACVNNNSLWIANLLKTVTANDNSLLKAKDSDGWSPLVWTARHGSAPSALLKAGADVNDTTHTGDTPLSVAALYGNTTTGIQLIQSQDCKINTLNREGYSPLMYACRFNHILFAEALIAAGADVNTVNPRTGDDSLTMACRNGHQHIIKMLINAGAVELENSSGFKTAEEQAKDEETRLLLVKETRWFLRRPFLMALTQSDVIESCHSKSREEATEAAAMFKPPSVQEMVFFNLHREVAMFL